jgi:hypothetical protein
MKGEKSLGLIGRIQMAARAQVLPKRIGILQLRYGYTVQADKSKKERM